MPLPERLACDIDVVPDVVIWMVKWLHYLNYEAITSSSSTQQYFLQGTS